MLTITTRGSKVLDVVYFLRCKELGQCSRYTGEIWKRSVMSTPRPIINNSSRKRRFMEMPSNRRNLKCCSCVFAWADNNLETELFANDDVIVNHVILLLEFSRNTILNLNFSGVTWTDKKHIIYAVY